MNQESSQPTPVSQVSNTPPKKNFTWLLLAIIAVLLVGNIYLFMSKSKVSEQNTFLINENTDISSAKDTLQRQFDAANVRLDELTGKNAALDSMLQQKDGEVGKLKNEIKSLLSKKDASVADLKKAQSLIATLRGKVKTYEDRIAELEGENTKLTTTNKTLNTQKDSVVGAAEQLKKIGSVLHVSNIKMEPIKLKRHGTKEVETTKAKRVDILRIIFDIDENRIAESGSKEIYILITGPDGKLLSNAAYGSGVTTDADGATLNYTLVKKINLEKGQQLSNVGVDWKQDSDYKRGEYSITFYNGGYKIGTGSVTLR
jgi:predicted nuclease with TOPRIM domain